MTTTRDLAGVAASREALERLEVLEVLEAEVRRWTPAINLVSQGSLPDLWTRHVADSAQLWPLAPGARTWVDLGAGAGFPGLVVAALGAPALAVTLIESDGRKAAFLRGTARAMGLAVTVLDQRAEAAPPQGADVVSARALAPLAALLPLVARHLAPAGTALLPKGRAAQAEVAEARARGWRFDLDAVQSRTDPDGRILRLRALARG